MIQSIDLINFRSHQNTHLDLSSGITVICGSSTCGKTNIFRAIHFVAFNRPLGDRVKSKFSGKNEKTEVTIKTDRNVISLIKFDSDEEGYYLDGIKLNKFGTEVPEEIQSTLNLSEINFQEQLSSHFLITDSPSEITRKINQIVHLDQVDEWVSSITTDINSTNKEIKFLDEQLISLTSELSKYDVLNSFEIVLQTAEELQDRISDYENKISDLNAFSEELEHVNKQIEEVKIVLEIKEFLPEIEESISRLQELNSILTDLETLLSIQSKIEKNQNIKKVVLPIIIECQDIVDSAKEIDLELALIEDSYEKIIKIDKGRNEWEKKRNKLQQEFIQYLKDTKQCPICFSDFTEERIKQIVNGDLLCLN